MPMRMKTDLFRVAIVLVVWMLLSTNPFGVSHAQGDIRLGVAVAWNIDGTKLAVAYQGGAVDVFDVMSGDRLRTYQPFTVVRSLGWHPTNPNHLAIGGSNFGRAEGLVQVVDVATNQILLTLDGGQTVSSISWSPDGTKLVAASNTITPSVTARNELRIWDITSGELLTTIPPVSFGTLTDVDWSPDGDKIAASSGYSVAIWDANTGNVLHVLEAHTAVILSVAWNYDGSMLATASLGLDHTVRIWDTVSGQNLASFPTNFSGDMAWNPIRNELAVSEGQGASVLDALSGDELAAFPAMEWQQAVACTPYGGRLAFAGQSITIAEGTIPEYEDTPVRNLSSNMAVQIVVPDPSLDRLNSIAQGCIASTAQRSLSYPADEAQLPAFVAQLDALTDAHIPPACRADLLAIVEALAGE